MSKSISVIDYEHILRILLFLRLFKFFRFLFFLLLLTDYWCYDVFQLFVFILCGSSLLHAYSFLCAGLWFEEVLLFIEPRTWDATFITFLPNFFSCLVFKHCGRFFLLFVALLNILIHNTQVIPTIRWRLQQRWCKVVIICNKLFGKLIVVLCRLLSFIRFTTTCPIEGESFIKFGLFQYWGFVIFNFFIKSNYVLSVFRDKLTKTLFKLLLLKFWWFHTNSAVRLRCLRLMLQSLRIFVLMKIIKRLNKLFRKSSLILVKPFLSRPKGSLLNILYLELYILSWNRRKTDVKVRSHWKYLF